MCVRYNSERILQSLYVIFPFKSSCHSRSFYRCADRQLQSPAHLVFASVQKLCQINSRVCVSVSVRAPVVWCHARIARRLLKRSLGQWYSGFQRLTQITTITADTCWAFCCYLSSEDPVTSRFTVIGRKEFRMISFLFSDSLEIILLWTKYPRTLVVTAPQPVCYSDCQPQTTGNPQWPATFHCCLSLTVSHTHTQTHLCTFSGNRFESTFV